MMECDRIDISEDTDTYKTDGLPECIMCRY